jgi:hypothetical protein
MLTIVKKECTKKIGIIGLEFIFLLYLLFGDPNLFIAELLSMLFYFTIIEPTNN